HDHSGDGDGLHQGKMDVTRTRRHIDHEIIQLIPMDFGYELADGAAGHGATPDHRILLIDQQADAHELDAIFFERDDDAFAVLTGHHHRTLAANAKHNGNTGAIDIGIHETDACAPTRQGQ